VISEIEIPIISFFTEKYLREGIYLQNFSINKKTNENILIGFL
jgi:hypothetical protein